MQEAIQQEKTKIKVFAKDEVEYAVLEISPSKMTSNQNVKWLITEFARLFRPLDRRINLTGGGIRYTPEFNVWWEVFIYKGEIHFYLIVPDREDIKESLTRQVMKTWKKCNVREIKDYMPTFEAEKTDITNLTLKHNAVLSLDTNKPQYSPLDSFLNAKHFLKEDDMALLQIGLRPQSNSWNNTAKDNLDRIKKSGIVPRKKGKKFTLKEFLSQSLFVVGMVAEELMNLLGDLIIPGWEDNRALAEMSKTMHGDIDTKSTPLKVRADNFQTNLRVIAQSDNRERRQSMIRAISGGFDPLEGDNKLVEEPVTKGKEKELKKVTERKMTVRMNGDYLCSLELAKIIQVPDQKAQIEHYNELSLVQHRGEADVPKEIFKDDGGIPFATYEDNDGEHKVVYFSGKNPNLLCMPRVVIGEPGSGKTTFAVSFALDAFNRGYGVFLIDAADGKSVQRVLDRITPAQREKVRIVDLLNSEMPMGLGWNEIFRGRNTDVVEDLVVEEILAYIELVSGNALNMRAKVWVENAVKAVFVTPDATLQDVENMISNAGYRAKIIPTIEDPELRADWENFHDRYTKEDRATIYDEAFRRLAPVMRKKALKNFILQKPKKDEAGDYLFDIRRWMDEGCMVLVRANETLGENIQTALVSFLIAKFNLAIISREDIIDEDDRKPCFLLLDEPDHYIKGSERWRNMLTRYRKYRCGLVFMFHGWEQLKKTDRDLPKMIRKAGPHYLIFQTDEDNLEELKSVIQPEFKIADIAKGMPKQHLIVKLKMYSDKGEATPAFMAKAIDMAENRYPKFPNNDLFPKCAELLGRPKKEVMEEIFRYKNSGDIDPSEILMASSSEESEELLEEVKTFDDEEERNSRRKSLEKEVEKYLETCEANDMEPDPEILEIMDDLMEEG
jgi:hypothetical protein